MRKLLITDLDNTLYNLIDYFGPSFRGMVHALSKATQIEEEILLKEFKKVFSKRESLEYGFAVQELSIFSDLSQSEMLRLITLAKKVFKRCRDKNLKPYKTVQETLEWLKTNGVIIIGVSNAPFFNAEIRLKQLFLDKYFYGLAAREDLYFPKDPYTQSINLHKASGKYHSSKLIRKWKLNRDQLKPNTYAYRKIINDLNVSVDDTYVIGDSILKDVQPAIDIGAIGIWARYGEKCNSKNLDTVLKMTNWSEAEIKRTFFDKHNEPKFIADSFGDLTSIVDIGAQLSLFP